MKYRGFKITVSEAICGYEVVVVWWTTALMGGQRSECYSLTEAVALIDATYDRA